MRRFAPTGNTRRSAPIGAQVSGTRGRVRPEQAPESSGIRTEALGRRVQRALLEEGRALGVRTVGSLRHGFSGCCVVTTTTPPTRPLSSEATPPSCPNSNAPSADTWPSKPERCGGIGLTCAASFALPLTGCRPCSRRRATRSASSTRSATRNGDRPSLKTISGSGATTSVHCGGTEQTRSSSARSSSRLPYRL
jgi:hypothetical protein